MSDFQIARLKGGHRMHRKLAGEWRALCGGAGLILCSVTLTERERMPTLDRAINALEVFTQAAAVIGLLLLAAGLGLPGSMFAVTVEDMADDGEDGHD